MRDDFITSLSNALDAVNLKLHVSGRENTADLLNLREETGLRTTGCIMMEIAKGRSFDTKFWK